MKMRAERFELPTF